MIDLGIKKIPDGHIMKRWTRNARDYQYPDDVCTSAGEQLGQSLLYANALDAVKSTDQNPKAGEILTRYLNMARKEIEGLQNETDSQIQTSDGNTTTGYISASGNESKNEEQQDYDSDGSPVVRNIYGASGSSAYMSDADINNIKAPFVPQKSGRQREKRFKPLFERKRKGRKRYTANPMSWGNIQEEANLAISGSANQSGETINGSKNAAKKGKRK